MKWGKWIGGGLGWVAGGPIGLLVGFIVGTIYDSATTGRKSNTTTQPGDFAVALVVVTAMVMKADNVIKKSELDYVKNFFIRNFGETKARQALLMLRDVLKKEIPAREVCEQLRINLDYSSKLQMLHYMFGIAASDGEIHPNEVAVIRQMAQWMDIKQSDYNSIQAMFVGDEDAAYKILEIEKTATDEEVKKAYRAMAIKYHPDKVAHLGDDVQRAAKEKFQKLQEAYETVKKQRGMK
ncbi:MAG: TerB family tellurite resistance protein [Bacteroidales bacterium]|nr:TerB family tellurite resistance protein [Bacteroidales bacterium]HOY38920.1 TerB family tellurite resistance protein [Bacteroidales bacterium]HQN92574.1 TerB family tellurite resistance protein [Prolixibacteraceae bacterium]